MVAEQGGGISRVGIGGAQVPRRTGDVGVFGAPVFDSYHQARQAKGHQRGGHCVSPLELKDVVVAVLPCSMCQSSVQEKCVNWQTMYCTSSVTTYVELL